MRGELIHGSNQSRKVTSEFFFYLSKMFEYFLHCWLHTYQTDIVLEMFSHIYETRIQSRGL